jgi:5-methylcytosine-specific restriction endonuclease McrA
MKKKDREIVFLKYNGKCAYCGCELVKGWHVDHIQAIRRNTDGTCENPELDVLENYNPSCASCNINKHSMTLEEFRASIKKYVESLNNYSVQYKIAKRFGLIKETNIEVKFYFETVHIRY